MSHTENVRLPKQMLQELQEDKELSVSAKITQMMRDCLDGKIDIEGEDEHLKATSFTTDASIAEKFRNLAKEKHLSFNKALVLAINKSLSHKESIA